MKKNPIYNCKSSIASFLRMYSYKMMLFDAEDTMWYLKLIYRGKTKNATTALTLPLESLVKMAFLKADTLYYANKYRKTNCLIPDLVQTFPYIEPNWF